MRISDWSSDLCSSDLMTVRKRRPPPEGDIEVCGVDEQDAEPVELQRWVDLASNVLRDSGVRGEEELSLLFVNEEVIAELNGRFMGEIGSASCRERVCPSV